MDAFISPLLASACATLKNQSSVSDGREASLALVLYPLQESEYCVWYAREVST